MCIGTKRNNHHQKKERIIINIIIVIFIVIFVSSLLDSSTLPLLESSGNRSNSRSSLFYHGYILCIQFIYIDLVCVELGNRPPLQQ